MKLLFLVFLATTFIVNPVLASNPNEALWIGDYALISGQDCKQFAQINFSFNGRSLTLSMADTTLDTQNSRPNQGDYYFGKMDGKVYKYSSEGWKSYYYFTRLTSSEKSETIVFKQSLAKRDVEKNWNIAHHLEVNDSGLLHVKMDYKLDVQTGLKSFECSYQKH